MHLKEIVLPTYQAPHSPAPRSISAGRERCAARSCPHDFFQVHPVIACITCMRSHTHTHTHTHTANKRNNRSAPHAARMQHPPRPSKSLLAGAAGQHGKTAAPPANARPSPRVAGRTQSQQQRAPRRSPTETLQCRASTRPRPHPARAGTASTPTHATHDRPARARARRRSSGGVRPPGTAQPRAQEHGTPMLHVTVPVFDHFLHCVPSKLRNHSIWSQSVCSFTTRACRDVGHSNRHINIIFPPNSG